MPTTKKGAKLNFTNPPKWNCEPGVGFIITDEMKKILAQPGFLTDTNGGPRLQHLYSNQSLGFRVEDLSEFGKACFLGLLKTVQYCFMTGMAPPLTNTETPYEFGYATLVVTGSQRVIRSPGFPHPEHLAVLEFLISRSLPLNVPDIVGYTAIQHCVLGDLKAYPGKEALIRKLLASGAEVDYRNRWGETALSCAIQRGDIVGIDLLMEYGASVDIPNGNGKAVRRLFLEAGATVNAAMEKWLLKRSGKDAAPMTGKCCGHCGLEQKSLKVCSGCHTVQYCSRECQRAAWSDHKKKCKPFTVSSSAKLVPFYLPEALGAMNIPQEPFRRGFVGGLAVPPVPVSHTRMSQEPKNLPPGGKQVVVKVQVPPVLKNPDGSYNHFLVYTQKRDFACLVRRVDCQKAWDAVYDVIKKQSLSGLKGYFVADLKSRDEFVVKVSELLAAQPW